MSLTLAARGNLLINVDFQSFIIPFCFPCSVFRFSRKTLRIVNMPRSSYNPIVSFYNGYSSPSKCPKTRQRGKKKSQFWHCQNP